MFCNSTITDLFLFVFTQLILHYHLFLYVFSNQIGIVEGKMKYKRPCVKNIYPIYRLNDNVFIPFCVYTTYFTLPNDGVFPNSKKMEGVKCYAKTDDKK